MHKQFENIEVAVRARPLNNFETTKHAEAAWEIKKGGMQSNRCKQRSLNRPGD
jgi:DNA replication protein DnaC